MKIGIVGAGNVGGTLGRLWAGQGHDVMFGVRDVQSPKVQALLQATGSKARAGSVAEAAAFGEVVFLAVPWSAAKDAVRASGDLGGRTLVDCTNPLLPGLAGLSVGHTTSGAEEIARWAVGAKVMKAFNTTGVETMANPQFGAQQASMFVCGDDAGAKSAVMELGEEIGFDMIDAGPLVNARLLEPLAMLWIYLAVRQGMGRDIALKLLQR